MRGNSYDFDVIVIGAGAAGLTASGMAANFGAKTMLVEKARLGGDCTWTGCVPSKTLLKAGKVAHRMKHAGQYGLIDRVPEIDFHKVIKHVHAIREGIYHDADRPEIYEKMGIEVVEGAARFADEHRLEIKTPAGNREVTSRYFFICAGARAFVPPIKGLDEVEYLTNDSLFEIGELPDQLIVVGGGAVGVEISQAMNRLGSRVTLIEMADRVLANDDEELVRMLAGRLEREGIDFVLDARIKSISGEQGSISVRAEVSGIKKQFSGPGLLIAAGRRPNIEDLQLDAARIRYSSKGIEVNDRCRTSRPHIYACGDITGRYQFTHMSDHMAKVAVTNALLKYPMKIDTGHVPRVTYTDPELAQVGPTREQLKNTRFETYRFPYSKLDRAVIESETEGLIKVHAKKWTGKILGASVLGERAGELICEYALAMKNGVSLRNIADTIHPYPAFGLGVRRAADQYYIRNQSEWQVKLLKKVFGYRGEVPDFSDPDRIV